jgi:hypothetical protein
VSESESVATTGVRRTRLALWLVPAVLYAMFWFWYTPTGGPLTAAEIELFTARVLAARTAGPEGEETDPRRMERLHRFMTEDTGRSFVMVNMLDMADAPPDLPATGPDASADALMDHYMQHMYVELFRRASHPVFFGPVVASALDLAGIEGAEAWTRVGLVRYRSRRDMLEIATDPRFGDRHDYKIAALDKTIAVPVEPRIYLVDARILLALLLVAGVALLDILAFGLLRVPAGRQSPISSTSSPRTSSM